MYPDEIFFGLHAYELCLMIGMLAALLLADKMSVRSGFSVPLQKQLVFSAAAAILCGLLGAALFQAFYNFLETGEFSFGGMTFYGGLLFGAGTFLLMWFVATKPLKLYDEAKKQFPCVANMAAVLIPMAHGFGRIGCLFAGCCHGKITDAWYGVPHYDILVDGVYYEKVNVVPVQLFEAIFLFVLAGALLWLYLRNAKRGIKGGESGRQPPLLPVYMIAYGIWRFIIEYFRADERGKTIVPFLTPSQLIAALLIIGGIVYIVVWLCIAKGKKGGRAKADEPEIDKRCSDDENGRNTGV